MSEERARNLPNNRNKADLFTGPSDTGRGLSANVCPVVGHHYHPEKLTRNEADALNISQVRGQRGRGWDRCTVQASFCFNSSNTAAKPAPARGPGGIFTVS